MHPVIVITGYITVIAFGYRFQVLHQVIGIAYYGVIRIFDGTFIAHFIIGIFYHTVLMVGYFGQLSQQVYFIGCGSQPVFHLYQFANFVVGVAHLFTTIIVDVVYQIQRTVSILGYQTVFVNLFNQVAIAVIFVAYLIVFRVNDGGYQTTTIIAV